MNAPTDPGTSPTSFEEPEALDGPVGQAADSRSPSQKFTVSGLDGPIKVNGYASLVSGVARTSISATSESNRVPRAENVNGNQFSSILSQTATTISYEAQGKIRVFYRDGNRTRSAWIRGWVRTQLDDRNPVRGRPGDKYAIFFRPDPQDPDRILLEKIGLNKNTGGRVFSGTITNGQGVTAPGN